MTLNLRDKIKAALFAYAIGDALGKGTEFMTVETAAAKYPQGLRNYDQIVRDAFRSQWEKNDHTLDTEILLRMIECMEAKGKINHDDFAEMLREWVRERPMDVDKNIRILLNQPDYEEDPIRVSERCWRSMGNFEAHNEALGRAMLLGFDKVFNPTRVMDHCRMTHYDPRCVSTALVIGKVSHRLMWESEEPMDVKEVVETARSVDEGTVPYVEKAYAGDLDGLDLDDADTYWYTRKTMGAALWAYWHCEDPEEALYTIIGHGGDADTNAALGTALVAMRTGYDSLPRNLVEGLLQRERVERCVEYLTCQLENKAII